MKNTLSPLQNDYCHPISTQNYFCSPKMPVKDHSCAFRITNTSFKPHDHQFDHKSKGILENVDLNHTDIALKKSLASLKDMNLLKSKELHMISHGGADKSLNSNIHTRQTNAGYSRNTLGGVYTK